MRWKIVILCLIVSIVSGVCGYYMGRSNGRDAGILEIGLLRIPNEAVHKAVVLKSLRKEEYDHALLVLETGLDADIVIFESLVGEWGNKEKEYAKSQASMKEVYAYRKEYPNQIGGNPNESLDLNSQ